MCSDKSSHLRSVRVTEESALNTAEVENIDCNVNIIRCDRPPPPQKKHTLNALIWVSSLLFEFDYRAT